MQLVKGRSRENFKGDIYGGLTAAVVALPLALAFGVSSGAGAIAGIYGAIFVGLFAALFGGTPSQVSGPTGPMTVVMAAVFTQFSALDPESGPVLAFTVVIMAGALQALFGLLKLGKYITLMPFPVISGFMSGIGVIIIVLQLGPLLGHAAAPGVAASVQALPAFIASTNISALFLGSLSLAIVLFLPGPVSRRVPSALVALILGTLVSLFLSQGSDLRLIGEIPTGLPSIQWPTFEPALFQTMLQSAIMLAALGSIDSLLTSLVADNMTKTHHDSDRELVGQGIGNMVAGLFGGLPGAGATMRTVVNIRAGGKTPISGALHALILLAIVLGAGSLAEMIPHAVLAGILIKVGLDIIDWKFLQRIHRAPLFVVGLMLMVFGLTVFVDLVTAVLAGVFLANIITVKRLADAQVNAVQVVSCDPEDHGFLTRQESRILCRAEGRILLYHFNGPVSYGAAKGISKKLQEAHSHDTLVFDFGKVPMIDVSTAMAIEDMIIDTQSAEREVYVIGTNEVVYNVLSRMQILKLLPEHCLHDEREPALKMAYSHLEKVIER
ncbi:MAG: SulP family inorganic anion transporter [Pontibacterium sp.]